MKRAIAIVAFLVALAAFLPYLPALRGEFIWDDISIQTEQVPAITIGRAFGIGGSVTGIPKVFYRPAVLISYLIDDKLNSVFIGDPERFPGGRLDPAFALIPHLNTLLAHVAASVLGFLLCLHLLRRGVGEKEALLGAGAAGALFALHPVHAESIILIAGRSDSLSTAFLLGALLLASSRGGGDRPLPALGAGFLFLLALLSKEVAITGLVLLPMLLWNMADRGAKGVRRALASYGFYAFTGAAVIYFSLRFATGYGIGQTRAGGVAESFWTLASAFGWYLRNLVYPLPLTAFVPETPGAVATPAALVCFLAVIWLAWKCLRHGDALPLYSLLFAILTLLPSLAVVLMVVADAPVAQRYLYLPSFGLALGVGWIIARLWRLRAATVVGLVLLAAAGVACWSTSSSWRTNRDFWNEMVKEESAARHALPWLNLAQTYLTPTTLDLAEQGYRRALGATYPPDAEDRALGWYGLGNVSYNRAQLDFRQGRNREAVTELEQADKAYSMAISEGLADYPIFYRSRGEANLMRAFLLRGQTLSWDKGLMGYAGSDIDRAARLMPGDPDTMRLLARWRSYGGF